MKNIVLHSSSDLHLGSAAQVAFDGAGITLSDTAAQCIEQGRLRFETCMAQQNGYVYGSTTAPGARAKAQLQAQDAAQQTQTLRSFITLQAGLGGVSLPARCVRLALLARLSNALSGAGKLRLATVQALACLLHTPPPVPWQSVACSGEVIPLTWLLAPLADFPLQQGEAMALVNGSPFASALVCDVALTLGRRVLLAERIYGLSAVAAQCPLSHFDPRLADAWPDPYYRQSLHRLQALLQGGERTQLNHQAPTSWRVLPNVLASALQALDAASQTAEISLQALKDNPTFVLGNAQGIGDAVVSSGGYHDHRAAKSIDQVNNIMLDMCVLATRQVHRLLDGEGLGLPPLLAMAGDVAGAEFLSWTLTEPLDAARRAAQATTLDMSLHDPAGNQSDITSLAFVAWGKYQEVSRAFDACMACLATASGLAMQLRNAALPSGLAPFAQKLQPMAGTPEQRKAVVSQPLRETAALLQQAAQEMSSAQFDALLAP